MSHDNMSYSELKFGLLQTNNSLSYLLVPNILLYPDDIL